MNDDLFLNNIHFVKRIVKKMDYGYVEKDDLYQAGLIGLYKAIQRYNSNINNNFLSFASIYIISEIKQELRNNKLIILNKNVIKVKKYLQNNDIGNKSLDDIASELNVNKEIVFSGLEYKNELTSLNELKENEELINFIEDKNYEDQYKYYIDKLDCLSKEIIIMKYYKNYSQSEIAKILKCSQSTVSRIEKNALAIIKRKLC